MSVARDRSCDGLVRAHAEMVPTVSTQIRRGRNGMEIVWRNVFGCRPILSQYIDTPEKVVRFEEKMGQANERPKPAENADLAREGNSWGSKGEETVSPTASDCEEHP